MREDKGFLIGFIAFLFIGFLFTFLSYVSYDHKYQINKVWICEAIDPFNPSVFDTVVITNIKDGYVQFKCLDNKLRSLSKRRFGILYEPK